MAGALPNDMLRKIINEAQYPEILALCQTNSAAAKLCRSQEFWQTMLDRDFPGVKPVTLSPKELYRNLWTGAMEAIEASMRKYDLVNSRYLKRDVQKADLFDAVRGYIARNWNAERYEDLVEFESEVLIPSFRV